MATIIVPLDGSRLSEEALPLAEDLAKRLRAEVRFIQVIDSSAQGARVRATDSTGVLLSTIEVETERATKEAEEYLSGMAKAWRAKDIPTEWEVVEGRPATKIVEAAHVHDAYMIVMCTHGRTGLGQLVFGSVANEVLREAAIPVCLLRPTQRKTNP